MMRTLRDKRTMRIILWAVLISFVGFGLFAWGMKYSGVGGGKDPNLLAQVGDQKISYEDLNKACQRDLDLLYSSGEAPSNEAVSQLKAEALQRLVGQAILRSTAGKMGLSVSQEELAASLQREPAFLDANQKFDKARYYQFLQSRQMTPQDFEASVMEQMLLQKIHLVLRDSILYTPGEVGDYAAFLDRDLKAGYVELEPQKYQKTVSLTEPDLKNFYEAHRSQYDHPERVKARHILLGLRDNMNPKEEEEVKKRLEGFRSDILSKKAKFEVLAAQYSQDQGSKDRGGELGWFPRGAIVKEFEEVAFGLKKGELSKPFKTPYGYHIVLVEDHEKAFQSTFADTRSKALTQYQQEKAFQKISVLSQQLAFNLQKGGDLEKAAGILGLPYHTTSWFNRETGIPGLKDSKPLADAMADLYAKDWKGPVPLGNNSLFIQILDAKPGKSDAKKLEKEIPSLGRRLTASKEQAWMKNYLEAQKKALNVKTFADRI